MQKAKGAVLFMHGWTQSPKAYTSLLQTLADAGFFVLAPSAPTSLLTSVQQVIIMISVLSR